MPEVHRMTDFPRIDQRIRDRLDASLSELARLCAQPSVSADGKGMRECASLVADMLRRRGFAVQILDTAGAPVVFGDQIGRSDRTLLFYNHYDVQPPEPLALWETPPFQ